MKTYNAIATHRRTDSVRYNGVVDFSSIAARLKHLHTLLPGRYLTASSAICLVAIIVLIITGNWHSALAVILGATTGIAAILLISGLRESSNGNL